MEALLSKLASSLKGHQDDQNLAGLEDLWDQIDDKNEEALDALSRKVSTFSKKCRAPRETADSELSEGPSSNEFDSESGEEHGEDDEYQRLGEDDMDDIDYNEDIDESDFESLDPKEQLRLLMRPVKDDKSLYDDEELDIDEDDGEGEDFDDDEDEEGRQKQAKRSLNLDSNGEGSEDESQDLPKSTFQKQQERMKRTIAQLEAENIGEKEWALRGEVSAKQRPKNSLLEEDLEFEHNAKLVPVITEEVTESIEDIIRNRIKDQAWDDPERRKVEETQLASRPKPTFELKEEKSKESLAAIYEAEYQKKKKAAQPDDLKTEGPVDEATRAAHDELRKLFGKLCHAIDGLSASRLTPRTYALADLEIKTLKK